MTHRYLVLPFSADVAAFDERIAWIRGRIGGVHAAAIDIDTGATHLVTVGSHDLGRGRLLPIGSAIVAASGRNTAVGWFDAATGASIRTVEGALCGATADGSLIVVRTSREDGTRSLVEVEASAERTLYTPDPKSWDLDVVLGRECAWTIRGERLVSIPLVPGGTPSEIAVPGSVSLLAWRDEVLVLEQLVAEGGIRTRLHAINGRALRELATIDGEVNGSRSAATRDLLFASVPELDACVVVDLGSGAELFRIEDPLHACAASRDIGAISQVGAITIVARRGDQVCIQRIALPSEIRDDSCVADLTVGMGAILATHQRHLFVIDVAELAWRDVDVTFASVAAPRMSDPQPAKVVFAGAELVATDHPRLGRVTVKRTSPTPSLARGDLIVFDELRETAPQKFTVVSWHKQGETASPTDAPALVSRVSDLARTTQARPAWEPDTRLPALRAAAKRLEFAIPRVLEQLLALHDGDRGFRRLLDKISILIEVTGGTTTWSGSDPCMLGLAGNGGGDTVALYYYPPAHTPGAELPIVAWMHEDNSVEWRAPSFELYLASRLRDAENWAQPVVQAIRARLGLETGDAEKSKAPAWFLAAHGEKQARRGDGDLARERMLVRVLRDDPENAAAKSELLSLYERLGWQWHAEQLRAAEE